jgi:citrate lyase subunit beta / citryl-CoA lyase
MAAWGGPMRSLMFVPGHRQRMVDRALGRGEFVSSALDVAILDLEDGVPPAEKATARAVVSAALLAASRGRPALYVRVNATTSTELEHDLAAIVGWGLDAVVAPKVNEPEQVLQLAGGLSHREDEAGLTPGSLHIVASIESAKGLVNAPAIASCADRVTALLFGAEDFALDLGLPAQREGEAEELLHARSAVVVAAVAAGKIAIDGIWPNLGDADGLRRDSVRARRLGFTGKSCIHPGQVDTINEVFTPTSGELEHARRVVAAFERARARGDGAAALDGELLDPPIVERARRLLAYEAGSSS